MTSRPTVLISGSTEKKGVELSDRSASLGLSYPLALKAAGAMPLLLPCVPEKDFIADAVRHSDGILLTGGDDIAPSLYRKRISRTLGRTVTPAEPDRDLFELMLIDEVFRQRKPLLAICRGHQILNVALGGTLVVDIARERPAAMNHTQIEKKHQVVHDVTLAAGSVLAEVVGKPRLGVNSTHHQAVEKVAKPLRIAAVSSDGIIEGLELTPAGRHLLPFLLAVQFHPERLFARHPEHLRLFQVFVRACGRPSA